MSMNILYKSNCKNRTHSNIFKYQLLFKKIEYYGLPRAMQRMLAVWNSSTRDRDTFSHLYFCSHILPDVLHAWTSTASATYFPASYHDTSQTCWITCLSTRHMMTPLVEMFNTSKLMISYTAIMLTFCECTLFLYRSLLVRGAIATCEY